jgi:hypothetical protein
LAGLHEIQVEIGFYAKNRKHSIKHLAVLCGNANKRLKRRFLLKCFDQGTELDRFGPRSKNHQRSVL